MNQPKKRHICCVPTCQRQRFDLAHKFPKEAERTTKWLEAIKCPKLCQIPLVKLTHYQVCSRHFRVQDYKHYLSRSLNMTAVPSLNLRDLSQLHLSRAGTSNINPGDFIVPEVTNKSVVTIEVEDGQNATLNETDVEDQETGCMDVLLDTIEGNTVAKDCSDPETKSVSSDQTKESNGSLSTFFEVTHPDYTNTLLLNSFWLRCHCQCTACYDSSKRRRIISPIDIPQGIQPKRVTLADGLEVLSILWEGGHQSKYHVNFLFNSHLKQETYALQRKPWHGATNNIKEHTPFEYSHLVCSDEEVEMVFQNLRTTGVAVLENIPIQSKAMAKLVLCRLFPQVKGIHFKELAEPHSDICTHLSYSSLDCGLKCFFATQRTEIILVDGLHIARGLEETNASAFKTLSNVLVPYEVGGSDAKYTKEAPIIEIDRATKEIRQLRLDVHQIGVLNTLPQEQTEEFYESLRHLVEAIEAEKNQWVLTLESGSMVVFDNWRVFHRCCAASGVSECSMEQKDFVSRMQFFRLF